MNRVGVRELRQNASKVLARVKAGEVVDVTERGTVVARIVPVSVDERAAMIESGQLVAATRDARRLAVPTARLPKGVTSIALLDELGSDLA